MKRKVLVVIMIAVILLCPFHISVYRDGGTKVYSSLAYKVVQWKKVLSQQGDDHIDSDTGLESANPYRKTRIYLLPDNFRSLDDLWESEKSIF